MIYLDGNVQVFENIDHMFDYPDSYFYATLDCFCEKSWSHGPQHKIGYCQQWPNKVQWDPTLGPKPPPYFNASMFVFEPSLVTYRDLVQTLQTSPTTAFAEQVILFSLSLSLSILFKGTSTIREKRKVLLYHCLYLLNRVIKSES